ncbi:hypothetical protein BDZ45DRAFT_598325, partial [Acephala macrosclerotiorum]
VEDAMRVTRELGYTFLWVDRYCITQYGKITMQGQLQSMNLLYQNAELTIIAAAGDNSFFGLPGVSRRTRIPRPCVQVRGHILTAIHPEPKCNIQHSVWNTRGWTCQEGLLSRQRLVFTKHEFSYKCPKLLCRESIQHLLHIIQPSSTFTTPSYGSSWVFPTKGAAWTRRGGHDLFDRLEVYTSRRLTYEFDILNAMLGVLQV